MLQSSMG